ncbi:MAG: malonate decarboxylase holo-[acyl-carrier-protein] synthase [Verrucomicrobia bacterium]|nr:malonate decarboxylase holo-[acyl-carrier-protein] synthase [Verrucomicrobiota bacterium]
MIELWQRHDLLRVKSAAWLRILQAQPRFPTLPHVARWAERRRPLIVRRRAPGDAPDQIPVALPLPPACGKARLAAQLFPDEIAERVPPLTLRELQPELPPVWQPLAAQLLDAAKQTGVESPRVFGSWLWQRLTGLAYVTARSDLDLLWPLRTADDANRLVGRLASIAAKSVLPFDGEILLPDGSGVHWREWRTDAASEVLVKTMSGVQLRARASLFPTEAEAA